MIKTVKASKVKAGPDGHGGDFIPALDHAYVIDVSVGEYDVDITFNDAEGGEGTLTCGVDMPITVDRR